MLIATAPPPPHDLHADVIDDSTTTQHKRIPTALTSTSTQLSTLPRNPVAVTVVTAATSIARYRHNSNIHILHTHNRTTECEILCEKALHESLGQSEYALYMKAQLSRVAGALTASTALYQAAVILNPHNVQTYKQVAKNLQLSGKPERALEIYGEALNIVRTTGGNGASEGGGTGGEWSIYYGMAECYVSLKRYTDAIKALDNSLAAQRHDCTALQLARVHGLTGNRAAALETLMEAVEYSPENSTILQQIGTLYLAQGDTYRAFDSLGAALTYNPRDFPALLAVGSVMQDYGDYDVALVKYRVAAVQQPRSPALWNNVGMALHGKQRYTAALACCTAARQAAPLDWIINYNLGVVHLATKQYASAFMYLNATLSLLSTALPLDVQAQTLGAAYGLLAIALQKLGDTDNARSSYAKSLELDASDLMVRVNFATMLYNNGEDAEAKEQCNAGRQTLIAMDDATRKTQADAEARLKELVSLLAPS